MFPGIDDDSMEDLGFPQHDTAKNALEGIVFS